MSNDLSLEGLAETIWGEIRNMDIPARLNSEVGIAMIRRRLEISIDPLVQVIQDQHIKQVEITKRHGALIRRLKRYRAVCAKMMAWMMMHYEKKYKCDLPSNAQEMYDECERLNKLVLRDVE